MLDRPAVIGGGMSALVASLALLVQALPANPSGKDPYLITRSSVGGVRIGESLASVKRAMPVPPTAVGRYPTQPGLRRGEVVLAYPWFWVTFLRGRAISVEADVSGGYRTVRGDGIGTPISVFRSHWRDARKVIRDVYDVEATQSGYVLVFFFFRPEGLRRIALISRNDLSCRVSGRSC